MHQYDRISSQDGQELKTQKLDAELNAISFRGCFDVDELLNRRRRDNFGVHLFQGYLGHLISIPSGLSGSPLRKMSDTFTTVEMLRYCRSLVEFMETNRRRHLDKI
ncbi:hypothetical protein TNIN_469021 [Trichonephila inaurata madagascariensis]|uniref:Uncharacterized protein n=1 Tax=Trichonephila inaurata madagascariensis TaxID=2747483 RepID=A0A8X6YLY3_9ARAC|nr:hypothetical protein TNIN_469021 [Trichonephila inaurata madagascariensis]